MKYDFITIGGATRDISFFTGQGVIINNKKDILRQQLIGFEIGAKIKVDKFYYAYGGGATNAAVCLANFGLKTACLANVGKDENGALIIRNLNKHKVETKLMKVSPAEASGSSFILIEPSGERIIFGSRGANRELQLKADDLKALKQTANIYLASLSGAWRKTLENIFSVVGAQGPKIYWNPGSSQYVGGLKKLAPFLKKTTVFALNKDEATELVMSSEKHRKLNRSFLDKEENLLAIIKSFGPEIVMITLGGDGVVAYDGQKIYRHKIIKEKKRVDTTGIGDVFNSSFAAGYAQTGNIDFALNLGLKNAAAKVSHLGAQNGLIVKKLLKK
ncbi:MAG: carbohydrate kinase family protein [Patescibacteria group bacterium]